MTVISGPHVGMVVEGQGDQSALPILLRKRLHSRSIYSDVLGKPVPLNGKGSATRENGIEGYVMTAARPGCVGVIVLLDADKDPVCELGPTLTSRVQAVTAVPVVVAIAEVDFEDWLYASIETMELGEVDPWEEDKRGKAVITNLLAPKKYVKPLWQPKLASRLDLDVAVPRSHSLRRLLDRFDGLVDQVIARAEAKTDGDS